MSEKPAISVIIPSYNKARYIDKTLKSIFEQKFMNFEVIVQDGGSNDGTVEIIKKYAKKYPYKISWSSGKDEGQLSALNSGIKKASGEIVTFINADDYYSPWALAAVYSAYRKHPDALWFAGGGSVVDSKNNGIAKVATIFKSRLLLINSYNLLKITNYFMQPSVFITRKAYEKFGPFTGTKNFVTEYDLWLRLSRVQMPVVINKNLSFFRIEPDTITKRMYKRLLREDEKIISKHTNNLFIIFLHKLSNIGRVIFSKFV